MAPNSGLILRTQIRLIVGIKVSKRIFFADVLETFPKNLRLSDQSYYSNNWGASTVRSIGQRL